MSGAGPPKPKSGLSGPPLSQFQVIEITALLSLQIYLLAKYFLKETALNPNTLLLTTFSAKDLADRRHLPRSFQRSEGGGEGEGGRGPHG